MKKCGLIFTKLKGGQVLEKLDLLKWFETHYAPSSFDGRFQIGYRKKNATALLPLVTNDRNDLEEFLGNMFIRPDYDYYITANAVSGVNRKSEGLFSFHNIVIDIDCHSFLQNDLYGYHHAVEEFIWRFQRDWDLPLPSSIVETGRGVQLWWAIMPVYKKCKPYLDEVRDKFILAIEEILDEYSDLAVFEVDKTASCNDVGYFRLPFSFNTKVNKQVEVESLGDNERYVLQDLVEAVKIWDKQRVSDESGSSNLDKAFIENFSTHEIFLLKDIQTLAFFRIKQLILLRKIRNSAINDESRNNLNFLVYNALLPAMGEDLAWVKLLSFNNGFKIPMSIKELEAVIVSAKEKGGYKYSNVKIIEFLGITPEEQEKIGLYAPKNQGVVRFSQHPSRDASRSLAKESRDASIRELGKSGLNQKEISEKLAISPATVSKVLDKRVSKQQQKEQAEQALLEGKTIAETVLLSGLSRSTIKRIVDKNKVLSTSN